MRKVPSYRLHSASGNAVVTLGGRDHYLGRHGSPESRAKYDRLIAEWLAGGRGIRIERAAGLTVVEVIVAYCQARLPRHGTSQADRIRRSLALVREMYGDLPVAEFRARQLRAVRQALIARGYNRRHLNQRIGTIKTCWRWALAEDLAPADAVQSVLALPGLRRGDDPSVPEPEPVRQVAESIVRATLEHASPAIQAIALVQWRTGARPGEVVGMRGDQIERGSPDFWIYRPTDHKTASRGHSRAICLGPRAIAALALWLGDVSDLPRGWIFPTESASGHFSVSGYQHGIRRAIARAGVASWHPHQLRHLAATSIRAEFGLDVARAVLGHRTVDTSAIYAEVELDRVRDAVRRLG